MALKVQHALASASWTQSHNMCASAAASGFWKALTCFRNDHLLTTFLWLKCSSPGLSWGWSHPLGRTQYNHQLLGDCSLDSALLLVLPARTWSAISLYLFFPWCSSHHEVVLSILFILHCIYSCQNLSSLAVLPTISLESTTMPTWQEVDNTFLLNKWMRKAWLLSPLIGHVYCSFANVLCECLEKPLFSP